MIVSRRVVDWWLTGTAGRRLGPYSRNDYPKSRMREVLAVSFQLKFLEKDTMIFSHAQIITRFENTIPVSIFCRINV